VQNLVSLGLSVLELRAPELATFDNLRYNMTSLASPSERSFNHIPQLMIASVLHGNDEQTLKISALYLLPKCFGGQLKIVRRPISRQSAVSLYSAHFDANY